PAFIASAEISARVIDGRGVEFVADYTAINRSDGPALADLFVTAPEYLGAVSLGHAPAVLAPGNPVRVLVPRAGTFSGVIRWTVPLVGDIQRRTANIPLPLAGGLSLRVVGDGKGSADAHGLAKDGDGWRLVIPPGPMLPFAWLPGGGGDDALVYGVVHMLDVQVQNGPRPLRWAIQLDPKRGTPPSVINVQLPVGFTCSAALTGVARLQPIAGGVEITRSAGSLTCVLEGFLATDAPVALPRIIGAAWQTGRVRLVAAEALSCEPPPGWRPLGTQQDGSRLFAVTAPDAGMMVSRLLPEAGLAMSSSTAIAVGVERSTFDQVLIIRAGGSRVFRLPLALPAGWKVTAIRSEQGVVPPIDELVPGSTTVIALPAGLAPGTDMTIILAAEMPTQALAPAMPAVIHDATRAAHRMLISGAPGVELAIDGSGWRQSPESMSAPAYARAELFSDGDIAPVVVTAKPRAAAVDVDAVCWLLPATEATWCRVDVRLAVRDGELTRLDLGLPLVKDADLRIIGDGLTMTGDGPFTIASAKPWRGERLLRIEGRLRPAAAGRIPMITVTFPSSVRVPVVRRWAALQAPGERDLQIAIGPAARPIDADELPAWANAIPGAAVAVAWRLGDGDAGGWRTADRALAQLPAGFIDALQLASQFGPHGIRTYASCRLAAAGLAELDLALPTGAVLEQVAIDGVPAAVRRDGNRLLLHLPSRTLVHLVVLYVTPLHDGKQAPPGLGGLPVTKTTWQIAVDHSLRAVAMTNPAWMPLALGSVQSTQRIWLSGWRIGGGDVARVGGPNQEAPLPTTGDTRSLLPPPIPQRPRCEPAINLAGQFFVGERIGVPSAAALHLVPITELRQVDVLGRALALIAGLIVCVAPGFVARLIVACAVAAIPLSVALLQWQESFGVALAFCEWLPLVVVVAVVMRRMWSRRRSL
ncbi:MAG: hypothetical protein AAB263_15925, partial [Planctomycetota bacterium]